MAHIALTFSDALDGKVDIQVYLDGVVEGAPATPAQKLAQSMLQAAKDETEIVEVKSS